MRRAGAVRRRRAGLVTASLCAALLVACGGEAGSSTATASATSAQSTSSVSVARTANGVYGGRYCELFLLDIDSTPIRAAVWNTYPFDDCPAAGWNAIDTGAVARDHGVAYSFKNGPRYWAVDDIEQIGPASPPIADFGGVRMQLEATLILGNLDTSPYIEHRVERHTVFTYRPGRMVAELHTKDGVFVMQSWSQSIDGTLTGDLVKIGRRLALPAGWTYTTRVLGAPLRVDTTTTSAVVLQDGLDDTYSREGP